MRIANPIYDVVFKYLLTNDKKVAKLIISNLIGKEVVKLDLDPTEIIASKEKRTPSIGTKESYTVMRLDFAATIKSKDGSEELILIEMQKAKLITDIMRFRKYLGAQYMNSKHTYKVEGKKYALPIFPIYILGHKLNEFDEPAISIKRDLHNALTGEKIECKRSNFIDGLSHDGLVIQVPCIKEIIEKDTDSRINKRLAELLLIFEQKSHASDDSEQLLEVDPTELPSWLAPILRTLEKAAKEKEVRDRMELEDDYIADLEDLERQIDEANKRTVTLDKRVEEEKQRAKEEKQRA